MTGRGYQHVDNEDKEEPRRDARIQQQRKSRLRPIPYLVGGLLLLLVSGLAVRNGLYSRATKQVQWTDCGETPEEARRRNCSFDILSFAWQTSECFDHETAEAFLRHNGTWLFYADHRGLERSPEEVVLAGEQATYVTNAYHITHCTYMWRQLHRAYSVLGYIDEHLDNWNHTLHCQKVLLHAVTINMTEVSTVGNIIYPKCRKI